MKNLNESKPNTRSNSREKQQKLKVKNGDETVNWKATVLI